MLWTYCPALPPERMVYLTGPTVVTWRVVVYRLAQHLSGVQELSVSQSVPLFTLMVEVDIFTWQNAEVSCELIQCTKYGDFNLLI